MTTRGANDDSQVPGLGASEVRRLADELGVTEEQARLALALEAGFEDAPLYGGPPIRDILAAERAKIQAQQHRTACGRQGMTPAARKS